MSAAPRDWTRASLAIHLLAAFAAWFVSVSFTGCLRKPRVVDHRTPSSAAGECKRARIDKAPVSLIQRAQAVALVAERHGRRSTRAPLPFHHRYVLDDGRLVLVPEDDEVGTQAQVAPSVAAFENWLAYTNDGACAARDWREYDWVGLRGRRHVDDNLTGIVLRSDIASVRSALESLGFEVARDIAGRPATNGKPGLLVYTIRGQGMVHLIDTDPLASVLEPGTGEPLAKRLSLQLPGREVVQDWVNDTMGSTGHHLWLRGVLVEDYFAEEGSAGRPDKSRSHLRSSLRRVTLDDVHDVWGFSDAFLRAHGLANPMLEAAAFERAGKYAAPELTLVVNPQHTAVSHVPIATLDLVRPKQ